MAAEPEKVIARYSEDSHCFFFDAEIRELLTSDASYFSRFNSVIVTVSEEKRNEKISGSAQMQI